MEYCSLCCFLSFFHLGRARLARLAVLVFIARCSTRGAKIPSQLEMGPRRMKEIYYNKERRNGMKIPRLADWLERVLVPEPFPHHTSRSVTNDELKERANERDCELWPKSVQNGI